MAENSKIEWTDHTFNPWIGCTKVAAGCEHCYAETDFDKRRHVAKWGPHGTRVKTSEAYWLKPFKWNRLAEISGIRAKVFCASLADVFEDWDREIHDSKGEALAWCRAKGYFPIRSEGPRPATLDDLRLDLFAIIDATPHLDWLLLTKRPENIRRMTPAVNIATQQQADDRNERGEMYRPNAWLLTSIATQADADRNIPYLLDCRDLVPVLGVSAEPLLGPVDLRFIKPISRKAPCSTDSLTGITYWPESDQDEGPHLDWFIAGGESGPGARPMHPDWARGLRDQCVAADVPFFFKQWGEWVDLEQSPMCMEARDSGHNPGFCHIGLDGKPTRDAGCDRERGEVSIYHFGKKAAGRLLDGREWNEFPKVVTACS